MSLDVVYSVAIGRIMRQTKALWLERKLGGILETLAASPRSFAILDRLRKRGLVKGII